MKARTTTIGLVWALLPLTLSSQTARTITNCFDLSGGVTCTSTQSTGPYYGSKLAAVLGGLDGMIQAWEQQRLRAERVAQEERQRQVQEQTEQYFRQAIARQQLVDEETTRKREAAYRVFRPKVDEVVLYYTDSIGVRGPSAERIWAEALERAQDVFTATPDATESRIREDLRPIFQKYSRRKDQYFRVWQQWVDSSKKRIEPLSEKQRVALVDQSVKLEDAFIAGASATDVLGQLTARLRQVEEIGRVCGIFDLTRCGALFVTTDGGAEALRVDDEAAGQSPTGVPIRNKNTLRLQVGAGDRVGTAVIAMPASGYRQVHVTTEFRAGPPAPTRDQVETSLAGVLPQVPPESVKPEEPSRPRLLSSVTVSALLGAAASFGVMNFCTSRATAPAPFGAFLGNAYLPAGSVSGAVKAQCMAVAGGGTFTALVLPLHKLRSSGYANRRARYEKQKTAHEEAKGARTAALMLRARMLDSAVAERVAAASRTTIIRKFQIDSAR